MKHDFSLIRNFVVAAFFVTILSSCVTISEPFEVKFVSSPCLIPLTGYNYALCNNMSSLVNGTHYNVPAGFVTDLASVPRFLYWKYPPNWTPYVPAAILHDYLYQECGLVSRKKADDILYYGLINRGVKPNVAYRFWLGVRTFGGFFFNKKCKIDNHVQYGIKKTTSGFAVLPDRA